jgi:dienelactone hydrolase
MIWLLARLGVLLFFGLLAPDDLLAQSDSRPLPRRGFFGAALAVDDQKSVVVTSVFSGSTAEAAQFRQGDVIKAIDNVTMRTAQDVVTAVGKHAPGEAIHIDFVRGGMPQNLDVALKSLPYETMEGATLEYGSVLVAESVRLRTIVSIPKNAATPLPAVLLIQGGGCGSIEIPVGPLTGQPELMHAIGRQGFVTMRVEKPGVGDSDGPPCNMIGYREELAGYQAALQALKLNSAVDPNRVFLLGISLGGTFAPIVARENPVAGIVVFGTLAGPPPPFPGRSRRFFTEFAEVDVLAAWSAVTVPILVLHGEYDEVTSEADHAKIASAVNAAHPGIARHMELVGLDHCWSKHAARQSSLNNCGGGEKTTAFTDTILKFMRDHS